MSEENQPKNTAETAKTNPNSPAERAGTDWEMPAPIFRVSEGFTVSKTPGEKPREKEAQIVHEPLPASPPGIQSEPGAAEQTLPGEIVLEPVPTNASTGSILGILMTAVGIFGMILFLIVLLGFVYFYFFYKSEPGSVF